MTLISSCTQTIHSFERNLHEQHVTRAEKQHIEALGGGAATAEHHLDLRFQPRTEIFSLLFLFFWALLVSVIICCF